MRLDPKQREILAGFFSNLAVVLIGFSLTDQPLVSMPMTWVLRWRIMGVGVGLLVLAIWIGRARRRGR